MAENSKYLIALANNETNFGALKEIFPQSLYVTLTNSARGLHSTKQARQFGLSLVATHPVYYLTLEQARLQRTLAAIRIIQPLDKIPPVLCLAV